MKLEESCVVILSYMLQKPRQIETKLIFELCLCDKSVYDFSINKQIQKCSPAKKPSTIATHSTNI